MNKLKKKKFVASPTNAATSSKQLPELEKSKVDFWPNYGYLVFLALYIFVDIVPPKSGILDYYIQHRLYIDIINIAAGLFIVKNFATKFASHFSKFFKNSIGIAYGLFILLSTISIVVAINKVEAVLELSRYYSNFFAFVNIFVLLYKGKNNIKVVSILMMFSLFYQVGLELYKFSSSLGTKPLMELVLDFKWTTGNKNIMAATILFKIGFAVYCVFKTKSWIRILSYVTLFLSFLSIFFISARTAYFSLAIMVIVMAIAISYIYMKDTANRKFAFGNALALILMFGITYAWADHVLTKNASVTAEQIQASNNKKASNFKDLLNNSNTPAATVGNPGGESFVGGRVDAALAMNDVRFIYWKGILEGVKDKPLLGVGIGNYKIYSPYFIDRNITYAIVNKYAHNDFVEIIAQSGWVTMLTYLALFIFATYFTLFVFFSSKSSSDRKLVAVILSVGLFAYFVDSFFNFPLGRTNPHIIFLIILSFIIINYLGVKYANTENEEEIVGTKMSYLYYIFLPIGVVCLYIAYINYKSSADQYLVEIDLKQSSQNLGKAKYTSDQVRKMLDYPFPSLGEYGEAMPLKVAKYLNTEQQYDKALKAIDDAEKVAPYHISAAALKVLVFNNMKKIDSAYKYSAKVLEQRPYSFNDYKNTASLASSLANVPAIQDAYKRHRKYSDSEEVYVIYINSLAAGKYDFVSDSSLIKEGLKKYPNNARLKELDHYFNLLQLEKQGKIKVVRQ